MTSFYEDEKLWLNEYSVQDLSRTLVREYLYQHNMFKTLNCFQTEDKQNSKKIVKSTVIKMLCINNLAVNNKKIDKDKQCKSLLMLLVQYLRSKFEDRVLREERSDSQSQNQNTNKEFSMNGDRVLPTKSIQANRINQKNLVTTKRNQNNNQKTLTQDAFYKKKDVAKQQKPNLTKKSSNAITQQKKQSQHRPSTAKPTIAQKKQQKKVAEIYSKLNVNLQQKPLDGKVFDQDQFAVNINSFEQKNKTTNNREQPKSRIQSSRNSNSAIGRKSNNILSQENESTQVSTKIESTKITEQDQKERYRQEKHHKLDVKSQQVKHQTPVYSQRHVQANKIQSRKQQVVEQYYDQFQEEPQSQVKPQIKSVQLPLQTPNKQQQQKLKQVIVQQKVIVQKKNVTIVQSVPKVQINSQPILPKKDSELKKDPEPAKVTNQPEPSYQPSSNSVSRGGMKLLKRTTKPLTQQQDATQVIGNNIKLLNQDIKPYQEDEPLKDNLIDQKKEPITQKLQFKIQEKPQISKQIKIQQVKKQQPSKLQQPLPQTNVRQIKLKKKVKNSQQQQPIPSKFKFDDNFVDQPLNGIKEKYLYEKFSFQKMIIKPQLKPKTINMVLDNKINYTQKPIQQAGNPYAQKKKNQKPLSTLKAQELKKIVFQKSSHYLPKAWHQGFILSPFAPTFYGLKQIQGGPCGIIAAVQCFFLKHLIYLSKPTSENDLKNQARRQNCLIAALTDILWKAKGINSDKITLVIPTNRNFSGLKLQFTSLTQVQIDAQTFESAYQSMWNYKSSFIGQGNHGVIVIIYSIIMTKGIQQIYNEVDMKENPLIGHHGHCTQELVNLFITGQASSNCFDGKKELDDNFTLHGIDQKSQFGFLTVFQTLQYIEVGKNLKNPIFPIWIISKEFHYHVIFGNHYLISENNDCAKFDLVYFDGLYACDQYIRLTFDEVEKDEFGMVKEMGNIKNLPLIQQVLLKKWGRRRVDWNGSTKIL